MGGGKSKGKAGLRCRSSAKALEFRSSGLQTLFSDFHTGAEARAAASMLIFFSFKFKKKKRRSRKFLFPMSVFVGYLPDGQVALRAEESTESSEACALRPADE